MPVQFWLSDDDHPCVFCGHVSPKGVVAQVEQHRFFACAPCLDGVIPKLMGEERSGYLRPSEEESHVCVCCGRPSDAGFKAQVSGNWSFTCKKCTEEVLPDIIQAWRAFGRRSHPHQNGVHNIDNRNKKLLGIERERARLLRKAKKKQEEYNRDRGIRIDRKQMMCETCKVKIDVNNLTCPVCSQLYCQYCGAKMNMEAPGQCPRCGGIPNYTPAPLEVTTLDDIPPVDRSWENLLKCPKCKAAMQPAWTECPFCGHKLKKKSPPTKVKSIRTALSPMVAVNNKELLSILTYLKVFRKRIAIHARYSYQKSQLARQKAIKLRKKGDDDGSRVQMKTHLQMQVSLNNLENVQLKLEGLQNKYEHAKTMKDVSDILTDIARTVQNLSKMVSPPEIAQMAEMFLRKIADWGLFP